MSGTMKDFPFDKIDKKPIVGHAPLRLCRCGGAPRIYETSPLVLVGKVDLIQCSDCGNTAAARIGNRKQLIETWNREEERNRR